MSVRRYGMKKLPTDLLILNAIYERYYETFTQYQDGDKSRSAKIYVPIDIKAIADDLKVDADIVLGRLYFHLDRKHRYEQPDGSKVFFFTTHLGANINCVNSPSWGVVLKNHLKPRVVSFGDVDSPFTHGI